MAKYAFSKIFFQQLDTLHKLSHKQSLILSYIKGDKEWL